MGSASSRVRGPRAGVQPPPAITVCVQAVQLSPVRGVDLEALRSRAESRRNDAAAVGAARERLLSRAPACGDAFTRIWAAAWVDVAVAVRDALFGLQ